MINELDKSTTKIDISYSNLKSLKGENLNNFNINIEFNNVNYRVKVFLMYKFENTETRK